MTPVPGLSAIIIARDEERDLPGCLESLRSLVSEIVVADSGSTDRTADIARAAGASVIFKAWEGYGLQKQAALEAATGTWALNIDADERVTPALAEEIRARLTGGTPVENAFDIPFRHYFLGKRLRFGRWSRESHVRLFRKSEARYGTAQIHEGIQVEGTVGRLNGVIDHLSYHDIAEYLEKCNRYTSMIAAARYAKGDRFHAWHHLRLPFEFFSRYILKLGFLDGGPGLTYALLSSYYVWLKFLKLRDMGKL